MTGRFDEATGDPLVPLPPFRLNERQVETLVIGSHPFWVVVPAYDEARGITPTLDSLARQSDRAFVLCVVDNNSQDGTAEVVRDWSRRHPDLACRLVHEPEKGVGAAADTGFRVAIAEGASLIARTDADCVALPQWVAEIRSALDAGLDLVTGKTVARRDLDPLRPGEGAFITLLVQLGALFARLRPSNNGPRYLTRFQLCVGTNMAIRASTYGAAGGFPRSRMEEVHEDRALVNRVRRVSRRIGTNRRAVTASSIRRLRAYGYIGILHWYYDHGGRVGPVDVR